GLRPHASAPPHRRPVDRHLAAARSAAWHSGPMTRIALIGGGRIGEALLAGLLSTGDRKPRDLVVVEKNAARTSELTSTYGVWVTKDLHEALEGVSMAVIAVKPVDVPGVLTAIAELNNQDDSADSADTVVVSLAAGISTAT